MASRLVTSRPFPEPKLQHLKGREHLLLETIVYHDWEHVITVTEGFVYDKASVPRLAWLFISPTDLSDLAPLLHDWLYRHGGGRCGYSRKEVDRLFWEIMRMQGVSEWRAWAAWKAVRLFGFFAYKKMMRLPTE